MQWRQFEWNANLVFLEEWEKYFKMSSVENFSQSVRRYGLHKQIAHGSLHGETYDVMYEETDQPAHSEPAHQYSDQSLR